MATAIGVLEVRGMAALAAATDRLFKAADVRLAGRHGIGSGWLTLVVDGSAADVQAAIDAARAAAEPRGQVITAAVLPSAEPATVGSLPHNDAPNLQDSLDTQALGVLETRGVTGLVAGVDAMLKAADVELRGWTFIGGALVHAMVTGTVDDVEAAVAAGQEAAGRAGELHDGLVLSQPEPQLGALLPPPPEGQARRAGARGVGARGVGALGVIETTGYVGSVAGGDTTVKGADIDIVRLTIGSGGRVALLVEGRLDDVRVAVDAAVERASATAELNGSVVIPGPDGATLAAFAAPAPASPTRPQAGQAMGLVETRTTAGLVKALDEMLKNADVIFEGRYKVGYFLTACVVRGDIGAVDAALDVARRTVGRYGELVAAHAIPYPYEATEARLPHG